MDTVATRRARLREWITNACEGRQAKFVEMTGINQGELSGLLKTKSFGEKKARSLEVLAGMPHLYLDTPLTTDSTPAIPAGASVRAYETAEELDPEHYVFVDRYDVQLSAGTGSVQWLVHEKDPISFRARWFQFKKLKPATCKALYVRGRSMEPLLQDYDTVLIDTSQTNIVDGDVYALALDDNFYIKAVHRKPGMIVLRSYNKDFEDIEVAGEDLDRLNVIGKMVWRGG